MHVRLFNVRPRQASTRNTVRTHAKPSVHHVHDPYAILSQLDMEFDSFGDAGSAHAVEAVAPGLVACDGPAGGPVVRRAA